MNFACCYSNRGRMSVISHRRWRLERISAYGRRVSHKVVALLGGALVACVVGGVAIAADAPPLLACAAAVAFVALGSVLPPRGLARFVVRRQLSGVTAVAFLFAFLGICLLWPSTTALDASTSWLRLTGWIVLAWFTALTASFLAALRHANSLRTSRPDNSPTQSR